MPLPRPYRILKQAYTLPKVWSPPTLERLSGSTTSTRTIPISRRYISTSSTRHAQAQVAEQEGNEDLGDHEGMDYLEEHDAGSSHEEDRLPAPTREIIRIGKLGKRPPREVERSDEDSDDADDFDRSSTGGREQRSSPAAVLGRKRLNNAVLPEELIQGMEIVFESEYFICLYEHLTTQFLLSVLMISLC